jgi:glycosyltransferase involved in cell wall biosynthesis
MSKILVGIPSHNRPGFIKDAIESVRAQSFTDIRVIISDDCSEQAVVEKITEHIRLLKDDRIEFAGHLENTGENVQYEFLLDQCIDEEYILYLHDDDRIEPGLLESAIKVLDNNPSVAFFSTDQYLFDENGNLLEEETRKYYAELKRSQLTDGIVERALERAMEALIFGLSGSVFRVSDLRECGLVESPTAFPADLNIFMRLLEKGRDGWWDCRKLAGYRWHSGQARKQGSWEFNEKLIFGFIEIVGTRKFTGVLERKRRWLLSFAYRRVAYIRFVAADYKEAYRYLGKAIRLDPFRLSLWPYVGFAIVFPYLIPVLWRNKVTLAKPK